MGISFVHIADVHIGMSFTDTSFSYELGNKRRDEIKATFFNVIDYCREHAIDLLFIAGDLFHENRVSYSELKDIQNKFRELVHTKVVMCAGNHDPIVNDYSPYKKIEWSENVYILDVKSDKISFDDLGIDVYGFSWDKKEIKGFDYSAFKVDDPSRTNLLMLHGDAHNTSMYLPFKPKKLIKKGFDYLILGHRHKPEINDNLWAYSGSLEPTNFKETTPHGFVKGKVENKDISLEFVPFAMREFIILEVLLNEELSFEEIKQLVQSKLLEQDKNHCIYRVQLVGMIDSDVNINKSRLKEFLEETIYYVEIIDKTENNFDIDRLKKDNEGNLIGEFILAMEEKGIENPLVKNALNEGLKILLGQRVS